MRLNNHIALRFLTDDSLALEIIDAMHPGSLKRVLDDDVDDKVASLYNLVSRERQKAFLVTETVHDKLDMLKVKLDKEDHYDWTVFKDVPECKDTFILYPVPEWKGGGCLRVLVEGDTIQFCHLRLQLDKGDKINGQAAWTLFFIGRFDNHHADHCSHKDVKEIYEFVYKLLCFVFLSDNEYQEVKGGHSIGTKKNGKFKNDLPIPVTIINSKWNVTTVRTEGFMVSGHFALRRCGIGFSSTRMVYIQPFQKHGYVRRAANEQL